ncbi:MAG: V-type ATP synthase subunit B, partial [Cellulosilyticum sp.]|nr:V-type ATP synthase subunit B [Cellulosilyticum sp.]
MKKEYLKLDKVEGPLIVLSNIEGVAYDEMVHIKMDTGEVRKGKVIKIEGKTVVVQVFEGTAGISTANASVKFTGEPLQLPLSKEILGRTFNGIGEPVDGSFQVSAKEKYNVNGRPINPVARRYPRNFIQTGISAIDCL